MAFSPGLLQRRCYLQLEALSLHPAPPSDICRMPCPRVLPPAPFAPQPVLQLQTF